MSIERYEKIIKQLLEERRTSAGYNNKDAKHQLLYDCGYLIGLVATLADADSNNSYIIRSRLNDFKKEKK